MVNQVRFQYNVTFSFYFLVCPEEHVLGINKLLSSVGRMWVSFYHCFIGLGACLMFLLHGFIAEQAYLLLWLSKAAFLSERPLTNMKSDTLFLLLILTSQ